VPLPRAVLPLALGLLVVARAASAQSPADSRQELRAGPLSIRAEEIVYEQTRGLYEARRNVTIEQASGRTLAADWIAFSAATHVGVAVGNVRLRDGTDLLTAEFAAVDLDQLVAVAADAELRTEETGFVVRAETLRKTGDTTYSVEHGNFTTCRCPPERDTRPWEVETARADVRVGGYAVARGVVPRVLGVPVFYVPWLIFPVKTERQTGFLIPEVASGSRSGTEVEAPFFWAAREDLNLLLRPRWYEDRGLKSGVEYEYVFGEEGTSSGGFTALPNDDDVDRVDPETRYSSDRWSFWLQHQQPIAEGIRFGAYVVRASDNDYVVDFDDLPGPVRQERFLESRGFASLARGGAYADVELQHWDDLQSPNDLDRDDEQLSRLPDVELAWIPSRLFGLPLRLGVGGRYTYFDQSAREQIAGTAPIDGQFFDTGIDGLFDADEPDATGAFTGADNHLDNGLDQGDGVFQEGELLADHGHRFELFPKLSLPLRLGPLEAIGEAGVRETLYRSNLRDTRGRTLVTGRLDTRVRFARDFRLADRRVRHVVEPKVAFAVVSDQDQDRNPLFVPSGALKLERLINADPRLLIDDPSDRVADQRYLEVSLANRLLAPAQALDVPARQLASLRLGSGYDFELGRVTNLFAEAALVPSDALSFDGEVGWDPKESRLEEARVRGAFAPGDGYGIALEYRFLRDLPRVFEDFSFDTDIFGAFDRDFSRINQASVTGTVRLTRRFDAFASGYLSFEESQSNSGQLGVIIHSSCGCWDLIPVVTHSTRPDETRFALQLRVAGFGFSPPKVR
jgi:lipopolysaccharide assembly outer membrane protein LptD (OstA)